MSRFSHLEFDENKRRPKDAEGTSGLPARDAAHFYHKGMEAYLNGDFELALRYFSRALEQHSAFYEGWFGQVRMLIELGEYEESLLWADKALEMFPDHPDLLAAKAAACARTGALEKAMTHSDNAVSKQGVTWYVWLARAEVLLARRSNTAEHVLRNCVNAAGNAAPLARLEAGRALLRAGEPASALDYLVQAVSGLPRSALAWHEMARCQAALGMPAAEETFARALQLRPNWDAARNALNRFCERGVVGRVKGAVRRMLSR